MISTIFHAVFYNPIYNALVALVAFIPHGDVGVAVILVTIAIRLILLPFTLSAARTQRAMKTLEPKIKELKEKNKGDKEKEALETLALYREAKVNPFSSILTVLIQIPVLLALYWVFNYEPFTTVNTALLYGFTPIPGMVSLTLFGIMSIVGKSLVLAVLAGLTQYLQAHLMLAGTMKPVEKSGMQGDFQKVMGLQLKYVFPFLIAIISYTTSGAVALYFVTTNLVGSLQEWYVRRKLDTEALQGVTP
ncbi:MAG: hypothetical protein JWN18_700 [Parcubacteria group bacterium]|nr:hypothetical protein [Parcubacteria group bacterium]